MDRDQVEAEVRARRQTPRWAERQAEANGWEPFAKIPVPWSHFDGAGKWPINFATMWLSCPSADEAAAHWSRLRHWSHHVWRDIPPDDWFPAQSRLSEALRKGLIRGWGKRNIGDAEWSEIPQDQWESFLDWRTDQDFATASLAGELPRWFDVRVAREDAMRLRTAAESAVGGSSAEAEVQDAAPAPSGQEQLNSLARGMPAGLRWAPGSANKKVGEPVNYEFHRALEAAFGEKIQRAEAWKAWTDHYSHDAKGGRPRRIDKK